MFSGLRSLVEDLAQPQPRPARTGRSESRDFSPERPGAVSRSSFDLSSASRNITQSTGLLAESAITNLRKSLASQRPFAVPSQDGRGSPRPDRELRPVSKPTLEDRLKASFAIGEASNVTTPGGVSQSSSPKPVVAQSNESILSPKSTPLPESPVQSPTPSRAVAIPPLLDTPSSSTREGTYTDPLQMETRAVVEEPEKVEDSSIVTAEEVKVNKDVKEEEGAGAGEGSEGNEENDAQQEADDSTTTEVTQIEPVSRLPEADIPLPPFSPEPTNLAASQSSRSPPLEETPHTEFMSVDSLKRLVNSLEQRLAGDELLHIIY